MKKKALKFFDKHTIEIMIVLLGIIVTALVPAFLTTKNLLNVLKNMSVQGVIAFGMTMVIVSGDLDLSVGSSVALTTVLTGLVAGRLSAATGLSLDTTIFAGMLASLLVSILIGFLNSVLIVKYSMPAMIATLGMSNIAKGIAAIISEGFPVLTFPSWWGNIGSYRLFGVIPVPVIILLIVFAITFYLLSYTPYGRSAFACGGNKEAARLSGIRVDRTRFTSLIIIQVCSWIAGIMLSGQVMSGNQSFGSGYEMNAISSVVIGGASINGGVGNMSGTLLGIIFLGILTNGMTLLNIDTYWQNVARGLLMLIAVLFSTVRNMKKN